MLFIFIREVRQLKINIQNIVFKVTFSFGLLFWGVLHFNLFSKFKKGNGNIQISESKK